MSRPLPIPGEYWIHKEFEDSDLELIPSPVYITGVDVDKGIVFGVRREPDMPIRGQTRSWTGFLFTTYMRKWK